MNTDIDPQDDLRDLITIDYRELDQFDDDYNDRFESPTMHDYLLG
jgi:hypothetical protein